MTLQYKQQKLKLTLVDYSLEENWNSHKLIADLRTRIVPLFPQNELYDPQDLEHQVLFRLTTFDPKDITDEKIIDIVSEQFLLIQNRLKKTDYDLSYIFRGFSGKHKDLNCKNRLELRRREGKIFAEGSGCVFEVEFKLVHDEKMINLFTNELHYMHQSRLRGETFGLFFKNDEIPFAIETTEPAIISREYKQESLLAQGIDPSKAIELTRFYTLPGSPINAISIMDGLVSKYYKSRGIEALFTTTMPMYSKTKSTTIAGGMNQVLLIKPLMHKFIPILIEGKKCYQQVTSGYLNKNNIKETLTTHPNFPTMFTVEVFMRINKTACEPLDALKNKVIKIERNKISKKLKFRIKSIPEITSLLSSYSFIGSAYERKNSYSFEDKKIDLIIEDHFNSKKILVFYNYLIKSNADYPMYIKEIIYDGSDLNKAMEKIMSLGSFSENFSYEQIKFFYEINGKIISLEILPFGSYLVMDGDDEEMWNIAGSLGFPRDSNIVFDTEEEYIKWTQFLHISPQKNIFFGLNVNH